MRPDNKEPFYERHFWFSAGSILLFIILFSFALGQPVSAEIMQAKSPTFDNQSYATRFLTENDFAAYWDNSSKPANVRWSIYPFFSSGVLHGPGVWGNDEGGFINISPPAASIADTWYRCQSFGDVQAFYSFNDTSVNEYSFNYFNFAIQNGTPGPYNESSQCNFCYVLAIDQPTASGYSRIRLLRRILGNDTMLGWFKYTFDIKRKPLNVTVTFNSSDPVPIKANIVSLGWINSTDTTYTSGGISITSSAGSAIRDVAWDNITIERPPGTVNESKQIMNMSDMPDTGVHINSWVGFYDAQSELHGWHPGHTGVYTGWYGSRDGWCWNATQAAGQLSYNFTGGMVCQSKDRNYTFMPTISGIWHVNLQVNNSYGANLTSKDITILEAPAGGAGPTASITVDSIPPYHLDDLVNATSSGSSCYDCTERIWNITKQDPPGPPYHINITEEGITKYWPFPGIYEIVLEVRNASGMDQDITTVTILNITPDSDFHGTPTSGTRPLTVDFTDDSTGNITRWNWTSGDGVNISALQNPTFIYTVAGNYDVNLSVCNPDECNNNLQVSYIEVLDPGVPAALEAKFTPTGVKTGTAPYQQAFHDTSTGGPTGWTWNATNVTGNNTPITFSTLQNPTAWWGIGNWSIALNITDGAAFNDSTQETWLNISEGGGHECTYPAQEQGNIPIELMYILTPLALSLSVFAVHQLDNRIYANIVLGGFSASVLWYFLAANVITGNLFYDYSDKYCVLSDTPLFWLFVLLGVVMTLYTLALALEALTEGKMKEFNEDND